MNDERRATASLVLLFVLIAAWAMAVSRTSDQIFRVGGGSR